MEVNYSQADWYVEPRKIAQKQCIGWIRKCPQKFAFSGPHSPSLSTDLSLWYPLTLQDRIRISIGEEDRTHVGHFDFYRRTTIFQHYFADEETISSFNLCCYYPQLSSIPRRRHAAFELKLGSSTLSVRFWFNFHWLFFALIELLVNLTENRNFLLGCLTETRAFQICLLAKKLIPR